VFTRPERLFNLPSNMLVQWHLCNRSARRILGYENVESSVLLTLYRRSADPVRIAQ